jgi:hypothetical protein
MSFLNNGNIKSVFRKRRKSTIHSPHQFTIELNKTVIATFKESLNIQESFRRLRNIILQKKGRISSRNHSGEKYNELLRKLNNLEEFMTDMIIRMDKIIDDYNDTSNDMKKLLKAFSGTIFSTDLSGQLDSLKMEIGDKIDLYTDPEKNIKLTKEQEMRMALIAGEEGVQEPEEVNKVKL